MSIIPPQINNVAVQLEHIIRFTRLIQRAIINFEKEHGQIDYLLSKNIEDLKNMLLDILNSLS